MKKTVLALALSIAAPWAATHQLRGAELHDALEQEKGVTHIYRAYFPNADTGRRAAISFHAQLLESEFERGFLVLELSAADMDRLRRFGFRFELAADFIERRNQRLSELQVANAKRAALGEREPTSIPGYACYETVEETFAAGDGLIAARPALASWVDAGDSWLKTQGSGGYDMRVLKLTNSASGIADKPKLFINAAIHAREYATAPLVLEFARTLVNGHGVDADATWILDHHEVHLMLHANPDGRKRAETGLSWRKNVNNNFCTNSNNRGIDLNRNFAFGWNSTGGEGSSGAACDLTYRGPSAGSEPETQAVQAYARSLWPDRRGPNPGDAAPADTSGIHLDIHSYSQLVLWPWGTTTSPAPNGVALQTLGRKFAFFNNYSPMQSVGLYPTDGTSDGPSYGELGVAAYTFEIGTSFFQSCTTYNNTIKPGNLPALIYAAKVVRTPYITPAGPDVTALTLGGGASGTGVVAGAPVALAASATDARFNNSNGTEPTQAIAGAEYTIDVPPWDAAAVPRALVAADGSFNSVTESLAGNIDTTGLAPGRHTVFVRARDASGAWGAVSAVFLNISGTPPVVAEVEPNNTFGAAQVLPALPLQVAGHIAAPVAEFRDRDYYVVTLDPGRTLQATLSTGPESNFNIDLWTGSVTLLARSENGFGVADVVSYTNTTGAPMQIQIRVYFARGNTGPVFGTYTLDLAQLAPAATASAPKLAAIKGSR